MPCWEKREVRVRLSVANADLLRDGLRAAGLTIEEFPGGYGFAFRGTIGVGDSAQYVSGQFARGEVRFSAVGDEVAATNFFKRSYSTAVVKHAGDRFKWNVKATGANRFQVQRRF